MKSISKFSDKFFDKQKHSTIAGAYIETLFSTEGRFSLESVSDQHDLTYEQVHHFVSDSDAWNEEEFNNRRLQFMNTHKFMKTLDDGVLSIDDTQAIKYGDRTDGVAYQHCGSTGRNENCVCFVTSHYHDLHKDFPHKATTYYPEEESKIELACNLIDDFFNTGLNASHVAFDTWYCAKEVVRAVEKQQKLFVSKPKINRKIFYRGRRLDVRRLVTAASSPGVYYDKKVTVNDLGSYRLIVAEGEVYLSNDFHSLAEKIIDIYRQRWLIDQSYHALKDKLNLDNFQVRKPVSILRHLYLVFLAYTFFVWSKVKHTFRKVCESAIEKLSDMCQVIRNLSIFQKAKMEINDLLALLHLKPNLQV